MRGSQITRQVTNTLSLSQDTNLYSQQIDPDQERFIKLPSSGRNISLPLEENECEGSRTALKSDEDEQIAFDIKASENKYIFISADAVHSVLTVNAKRNASWSVRTFIRLYILATTPFYSSYLP